MVFDDPGRPGSPSEAPPSMGISAGRQPDTITARTPQQTRFNDTFPLTSSSMVAGEYHVRPSQSPGQVLDWTGFIDPNRERIAPPPRSVTRPEDDLPDPVPEAEVDPRAWNVLAQNGMRSSGYGYGTPATSQPMLRKGALDPTLDPAAAPPYISIASASKSIYSSTPVAPEKTDARLVSLIEENQTLRQNLQLEKTSHEEFMSRKELERENVARYVRTLEDKVAAMEMQVTRSHVEQEHNRLQQSQSEARMEKTAEIIQALREQLVLSEKRATDYSSQATELRKQLTDFENRERKHRQEAELERKNAEKREEQLKENAERRERQLKENFDSHKEQMRQSQEQRERSLRESSTGDRDKMAQALRDEREKMREEKEKMTQTLRDERENSRNMMAELKHLREATSAMQKDVVRVEEQLDRERTKVKELEAVQTLEQSEYKAKLQDAISTLSDLQKEYRLACELNNDLRKTATSAHEDNEVLLKRLQERTDQLLEHQKASQHAQSNDLRLEELQRQHDNLRVENASLIQLVESLQTNHAQQLQHHMQQEQQLREEAQRQQQQQQRQQQQQQPREATFSGVPIADIGRPRDGLGSNSQSTHSAQSGSDSVGDSFPRVLPAKSPPTSYAQPPAMAMSDFAARPVVGDFASRPGVTSLMSGPLPPNDPEPFFKSMPQEQAPGMQRSAPPPPRQADMVQRMPVEDLRSYQGYHDAGRADWLGDDGMPGVGPPPSGALTVEKLDGGWSSGSGGEMAPAPQNPPPPTVIPVNQGQGIMHQLLSSLNKGPPSQGGGASLAGSASSFASAGVPGPLLPAAGGAQHGAQQQQAPVLMGGGGRGREREGLALMEKSAQEVLQAGYDPDSVIGV